MIDPRHAHIGSAPTLGWSGLERHVLHMLGQYEWPPLEDENAAAVGGVGDEEVFGDDRAEGAAADDDHVEGAVASADRLLRTVERFLQGVAEKAAHVVQCEGRGFGGE
jgi:hypothetical protein